MGDFLKSSGHRMSGGWFSFWAAVLLILPNCSFQAAGFGPGPNLHPGSPPHTDAVFCDIAMERRCATEEDLVMGTRLASAAVALVAGQSGTNIGLDESPAALAMCSGVPVAVVFKDAFPRGTSVCLNCGEAIPALHVDVPAVCQAKCQDLFGTMTTDGFVIPDNPPTAETVAFCSANARVSTNFPLHSCFEGACSMEGTLRLDFADPRWIPEPVDWINLNGVSAAGGTLTRIAPTTGVDDAGASSVFGQSIAGGDGYLEFTAAETNTTRAVGLSSGVPPFGGIAFTDIGFGIHLLDTGEIRVIENGLPVGNFGVYVAGDRFRVKLRDNFDGTAAVSFARLSALCMDGSPCSDAVFFTSDNAVDYPVRVDAMIRDQNGTVTDARIVRIH